MIESLTDPSKALKSVDPGFETEDSYYLRAVRWRDYKLICPESGADELYRLSSDPAEETNLIGKDAETAQFLKRKLEEWQASSVPSSARDAAGELDPEVVSRLRALGYLEL